MRRLVRSLAVPVLAPVLALGLVACSGDAKTGGDAPKGDAKAVVQAATEKTLAKTTSKVALTTVLTVGSQTQTITADGAFDMVKGIGSMTLDLAALMGGAATATPAAEKSEIRMLGTVVYVKLGAGLPIPLPPGKFLKIDLTKAGKIGGVDLSQVAQGDPSAQLKALGALKDVTAVGEEDVRGVATTHYRGILDLDAAAAAAGPEAGVQFTKTKELLGTSSLPYDVWVDGDGLLRRYRQEVDLSAAASGSPAPGAAAGLGRTVTTLELFDFGTKVDVVAPPVADTIDVSSFLGG